MAFVDRAGDARMLSELAQLERSSLPRASIEVPASVETVLQVLGELPQELYEGMAVLAARRTESYRYYFARRFELDSPELEARSLRLVFDGVDTFATYFVNGQQVGTSANMLVPIALEGGGALQPGSNELVVRIDPPCPPAPGVLELFEGSPHAFQEESLAVRKAPHMYGWDIMPRLLSAGIWRGVRLESRTGPVLEDWVAVTLAVKDGAARLRLASLVSGFAGLRGGHIDDYGAGPDGPLALRLEGAWADHGIDVTVPVLAARQSHEISVEDPALWWPRGYGEPACYRGQLTLLDAGGVVDEVPVSFGLRTVELDRQPPEGGPTDGFAMLVNGERVFCYGPNWVPLDARHAADAGLYPSRLALLERSGANMVRCWGGGVYEDEAFFDATDAAGIMVWQDFAMACAAYPQDEGFARALEEEVTSVVTRLRRHPSLLLWCGDNEVDQINVHRGLNPDANRLSREVLPRLLGRLDPFRPYIPSSPYISAGAAESGDLERHGDAHLWGPRDAFWSDFYTSSKAPFVSEIGFMGLPERRSLEQMFGSDVEDWWPPSDERWLVHATDPTVDWASSFWARAAKTFDRAGEYIDLGGPVLEAPLDDLILASQIVQAEGFKHTIERARQATGPERSGLLWWNLVDGWPQVSDAVVDYYGRPKLAYHFIAGVQTPLLLSVVADVGRTPGSTDHTSTTLGSPACQYTLKAVNHSQRLRHGDARIRLADGGGDRRTIWEGSFRLAAGEHAQLAEFTFPPDQQALLLVDAAAENDSLANHAVIGSPPFPLPRWKEWLPLVHPPTDPLRC